MRNKACLRFFIAQSVVVKQSPTRLAAKAGATFFGSALLSPHSAQRNGTAHHNPNERKQRRDARCNDENVETGSHVHIAATILANPAFQTRARRSHSRRSLALWRHRTRCIVLAFATYRRWIKKIRHVRSNQLSSSL